MVLSLVTLAALVAYIFDPQSAIWNERLVPFWFIGIHLLAGWLVGYSAWRWVERQRRIDLVLQYSDDHNEGETVEPSWREEWGERLHTSRVVNATSVVILAGLLSTVPGLIPGVARTLHLNTSGNQVTSWAQ